jgi:hypothetical protein
MNQDMHLTNARLTTPRAAAIAGILFSLLLITSLILIKISVPATAIETGAWLESRWNIVNLALNLVPFAGIAFLWFIGVIRDRIGSNEDKFFATVFLGSGLLFLAMLFASAAVAGGLISMYGVTPGTLINPSVYTFGRSMTYEIMNVYAMKMAGVFMISTCTLSLRANIFPRWMTIVGYALAVFLIVSLGFFNYASIIFPLWVLMISIYILQANLSRPVNEI